MAYDYLGLDEAKIYIGAQITDPTQDALVESLITECSRWIDRFCNRWFYAEAQTRYFDPDRDVLGLTLYLDADLLSATTITNGDGDIITTSEYILETPNFTPSWGIKIKMNSSKRWMWTTSPENAIAINGSWGYNNGTIPPDEVKLACKNLVKWNFKHRNALFQQTGVASVGQAPIPLDIPRDIQDTLGFYRRHENRAI